MTYLNAALEAVLCVLFAHMLFTATTTTSSLIGLFGLALSFVFFVRATSKIIEDRREARFAAEIEQPLSTPSVPVFPGNPGPFASDLYPPRPSSFSAPTASLQQAPWEQPVAPTVTVTPSIAPVALGGVIGGAAGFAVGNAMAYQNRTPLESYEVYAPHEGGLLAAARAAEKDESDNNSSTN